MKIVPFEKTQPFWKRPERVVLAVTRKPAGGGNIITLGWKMRTSFDPPIMAISVGKTRYSHDCILNEKEFVLAFPSAGQAEDVLFCGTRSGRSLDKFARTSFSPGEASRVTAPLIRECPVNLECRLSGTLETGDHTVFAGEVLASWRSDTDRRLLLSVADSPEYEILARGGGHLLGTLKG